MISLNNSIRFFNKNQIVNGKVLTNNQIDKLNEDVEYLRAISEFKTINKVHDQVERFCQKVDNNNIINSRIRYIIDNFK